MKKISPSSTLFYVGISHLCKSQEFPSHKSSPSVHQSNGPKYGKYLKKRSVFGKDQFIPHFLLGKAALDVEQEVTRVTGSGAQ